VPRRKSSTSIFAAAPNRFPKLLSRFGALKEFHEYFSERPNIKAYLVSSRRPAALFYGPNGKIFPR